MSDIEEQAKKVKRLLYAAMIVLILLPLGMLYVFQVEGQSAEPSLDEKLGQLLVLGFMGTELSEEDWIVQAIQKQRIGGVILFDQTTPGMAESLKVEKGELRNIRSPEQLKVLASQLQSYASTPLLILVDAEGGLVNRLRPDLGFPYFKSAQELYNLGDPKKTHAEAKQLAKLLHDEGINFNCAPVVDLYHADNFIGNRGRTFSANPGEVVAQAMAFGEAHNEENVFWCLKHFPGHGSSKADSHLGLVDITDTWTEEDLKPFEVIIRQMHVPAVMTPAIYQRHVDAEHPVSLSHAWIEGVLRKKLGFQGVVITDDLQMKGVTELMPLNEAVVHALSAGNDLLLICNTQVYNPNVVQEVVATLKSAVESGQLSMERVNEAYERVGKLKQILLVQRDVR